MPLCLWYAQWSSLYPLQTGSRLGVFVSDGDVGTGRGGKLNTPGRTVGRGRLTEGDTGGRGTHTVLEEDTLPPNFFETSGHGWEAVGVGAGWRLPGREESN